MSKDRSALRNHVEFFAYRMARAFAHASGPRAVAYVGGILGAIFYRISRRRRRILDFNVDLVYPDLSPEERRRLVMAVSRHFGRVSLDALRIQTLDPEGLRRETVIEGLENLETARERSGGKGIFFLTAHIGSWEVAGLRVGLLLDKGVAVINRPLDNPLLDAELARLRSLFGNSALGRDRIARDVIRQINRGGGVGILIDQRARDDEGVEVSFLGHATPTHTILARLVVKTGGPVVPTVALWERPGLYNLRFSEPLVVDDLADDERQPVALTARLMEITGDLIRDQPEQWLWYHDRWRKQRLAAERGD